MLIITLITSLCLTWIAIYLLKPLAFRARLLDVPGGRKQHDGAVPLIGGLAIFTGAAATALLILPMSAVLSTWLLCALGIVLLGVADDAEDLPVGLRLCMQVLLTTGLCIGAGLHLDNLGNLLGMGDIQLGILGYPFTILVVLGVINAFNMVDGIDGLLGSVSMIALLALSLLLNAASHTLELGISLIFIAALIPYLLNNLKVRPFRDKIFMGDAGSMLLGMTIVWLLMSGSQHHDDPAFRPVTALWLIALPLMDMVRVIYYRRRLGCSPFEAGRDHLHHVLLQNGMSKCMALIVITFLALVMAAIGMTTEYLQIHEALVFLGFLLALFVYQRLIEPLADGRESSLRDGLEMMCQTLDRAGRKKLARSGSS